MTALQATPNQVNVVTSKPLVPSGVLGMALFIATEVMFFTALISGFLVLRAQNPDWPPLGQPRLPVGVTAVNTLILLTSGWTAIRALALHRAGQVALGKWFGMTLLLGVTFLGVQGFEWFRLIQFGLTTSSSLYASTFYILVGAHAAHVLGAVLALSWVRRQAVRGRFQLGDAESVAPMVMYWIFVVVVWPVLYGLVYFG